MDIYTDQPTPATPEEQEAYDELMDYLYDLQNDEAQAEHERMLDLMDEQDEEREYSRYLPQDYTY